MSSFQGSKINPSRFSLSQVKIYAYLLPLAAVMLLPILYIFSTAFKPMDELFAYPPRFFVQRPTLENFYDISSSIDASGVPLSRYLFNSVVSSLLAVACTLVISLNAGYVLSKKQFRGKGALFAVNTAALMFVPQAVQIPRYLLIEKSHLIDHFAVLFLPLLAMPVGLFLVKQFIDQVPDALIEAARIDGAGDFRIVTGIVAPIVKPALATVAILAFQSSWNNVEISTYYVDNDLMRTFAFYLSSLIVGMGNTVAGRGVLAAATLVMFLPNLVIFIFMQNKVLNTMAHSGIK
ncbi:MAG TPA: carbohydrate ABC transporter permease [Firmicutes bacterium]|nr:carbohydrate ABC transporter permease [Bacillota bacterium]